MKSSFLLLINFCSFLFATGQNVGIGTNNPSPSAVLELKATDKGFLPPRLDSSQRSAIVNPATGLVVYDTDRNSLFLFNGTRWVSIDQTNTSDYSVSRPNPGYTFSSPQFLINYASPNGLSNGFNGITLQSASISENLIVTSTGVHLTTSTSTTSCYFGINRNGSVTDAFYQVPYSGIGGAKLFCFDADSLEQNIYAVVNARLYRFNIANPADTQLIAGAVGNVAQIKVLANGDIILSTDLNNGSLLRILPAGTIQIIASNLRFPNYFDVFNNSYYVTGLNAITGTVKRITQAGVVSTVLSDVIAPKSIVFDKNGNFILQSNITLQNGNVFLQYNMFDASGQYIGPMNDANDNSIFTATSTILCPLYVDSFNNLVFMHFGTAFTTYIPNPVGSNGLWVIKLIRI